MFALTHVANRMPSHDGASRNQKTGIRQTDHHGLQPF